MPPYRAFLPYGLYTQILHIGHLFPPCNFPLSHACHMFVLHRMTSDIARCHGFQSTRSVRQVHGPCIVIPPYQRGNGSFYRIWMMSSDHGNNQPIHNLFVGIQRENSACGQNYICEEPSVKKMQNLRF